MLLLLLLLLLMLLLLMLMLLLQLRQDLDRAGLQKELELSGLVIANYLGVVELLGRMSRGRHQPHRVGAPGPCHTDSFRPAHARTRARARPRPRPRPRPHQPCHPLYLPERLGGQRRDLPEHATQRRPLGILLINRRYLPPARCPPLRHPLPHHQHRRTASWPSASASRSSKSICTRASRTWRADI